MKLTKSRLKQIIKEELEKIISDQQTLEEQIKYTEKRVKLGTTKGGRPRMGFAYTASFGGVSATGQPARDVVGAKRNAYLALMNKTAKPAAMPGVRPQKGSGTPAKMPKVPKTGSPARGMSVDAAGKPTGSGASTDLMQAKPAPMPQVKPKSPMAAKMPQVKPEDFPAKPAPMPGGGKFDGLGTTSILKKLFPNDRPGPAFKKLLRLPRKHPAREAYRAAYRKKDRS